MPVTEPNDVPFDNVPGADQFPANIRTPATGQFAYFGTFKAGLTDLADRTIFLKNLVDALAGVGGGTTRNLAKAVFVDVGGTGTGNIESPYGTVGAAVTAAGGFKLVVVAPGDYSGEDPITLPFRTAIRGFGAVTTSPTAANEGTVARLGPLAMASYYDGEIALEGLQLTTSTLAGTVVIRDCLQVSLSHPSEWGLYLFVSRSQISALSVSYLDADGCTFADGSAPISLTCDGTEARITNSKIGAGSDFTFTGDPGVLKIDAVSNASDIAVVNGTKVLLGLAEQAIAVTPTAGVTGTSVIATTPSLPKGTGKWLIRGQFQGSVVEDVGNATECGVGALLEVSTNGGTSWSTLTTRGIQVPDGIVGEPGEIGLSVGYVYTATGAFLIRLSAKFFEGTALSYDVNNGYLSATPIN